MFVKLYAHNCVTYGQPTERMWPIWCMQDADTLGSPNIRESIFPKNKDWSWGTAWGGGSSLKWQESLEVVEVAGVSWGCESSLKLPECPEVVVGVPWSGESSLKWQKQPTAEDRRCPYWAWSQKTKSSFVPKPLNNGVLKQEGNHTL